jgi:hypothetical protein
VYNLTTTLSGIVAQIGLAVALNSGTHLVVSLLALLAAIGAFGLAALVAGVSVWALMQGEVWFYGAASQYTSPLGDFAGNTFASAKTVFPAQAPYVFTAVAILGAVATLGLALLRLARNRQARGRDPRRDELRPDQEQTMRQTHLANWRFAQYVLVALCLACALFLITLSMNGRTVWTEVASSPTVWIRDAAGWDWLARGAGALTIIALSIGMYTSRRWLAITCTAAASVCLAWAASVAWQYSQDIAQGLVVREGYTVRTPEQIGMAAQVAAIASMIGLLLLLLTIGSAVKRA